MVLERGRTSGVGDAVGIVVRDGTGCWTPELVALLVSQVECVTRFVAHGIVAPRRQSIELCVARPRASGATLSDDAPSARVADHVGPGCGWQEVAAHTHHVVAFGSQSAGSVVKQQTGVRRLQLPIASVPGAERGDAR